MIRNIFSKFIANVPNFKIGFLIYSLLVVPIVLAIKMTKDMKRLESILMDETIFFVDKKSGMICRISDGKPLEHYGVDTRWTGVRDNADNDYFFKFENVDR